jgi:hypothetical protein
MSGPTTKEILMRSRHRVIGLHSFTRRLYRDVPDMFDELKKLFIRVQKKLNRLNPEKVEVEEESESELKLVTEEEAAEAEAKLQEELESMTKTLKKNPNAPTWFMWKPDEELTGNASVHFLKRKRKFDLKYHVADFPTMKDNFPSDTDFNNLFTLLKLSFDNYLEPNSVDTSAFDSEDPYIKVIVSS